MVPVKGSNDNREEPVQAKLDAEALPAMLLDPVLGRGAAQDPLHLVCDAHVVWQQHRHAVTDHPTTELGLDGEQASEGKGLSQRNLHGGLVGVGMFRDTNYLLFDMCQDAMFAGGSRRCWAVCEERGTRLVAVSRLQWTRGYCVS